jgi:Tfp pilus assembly protein PilF
MKNRHLTTFTFLCFIAFSLFGCASTSTPRTGTPAQQLIQKGITAEEGGQLEDAETSFRQAVNLSPLNWETQWRLGVVLHKQQKIEESVQYFREADRLWPYSPAISWLTASLRDLKRFEECTTAAMRWSMFYPKLSKPLAYWGDCETRAGHYETAVRVIQQGIEIENTSSLQYLLARAALLNGDAETARTAARRGLGFNDSTASEFHSGLKYYLIYSELAVGNMDEARRLYADQPGLGIETEPVAHGWLVGFVFPHSLAEQAGLRVGDVITHFNSLSLQNGQPEISNLVGQVGLGGKISLIVRRGNQTLDHTAVLLLEKSRRANQTAQSTPADSMIPSVVLHNVDVAPARIAHGMPFYISVDLTIETPTNDKEVPATVVFAIKREGQVLTRETIKINVPAQQRWHVEKEVPRAAGDPGPYQVMVEVTSMGITSTDTVSIEILPAP